MMFNETARRRTMLAAFFFFGPLILAAIGAVVYYRSGRMSAADESSALSARFDSTVTLEKIDYRRPGSRTLGGMLVADSGGPFLAAPEVHVRRFKSSVKIGAEEFAPLHGSASAADETLSPLLANDRPGERWEIPRLAVRASRVESLSPMIGRMIAPGAAKTVFLKIGRIEFLDDEAFDSLIEGDKTAEGANAAPEENESEAAAPEELAGSVDGSDAAILTRVERFARRTPMSAGPLDGFWFAGEDESAFCLTLDFLMMAADANRPTLIVGRRINGGAQEKRSVFDTFGVPFPTCAAARFFPAFQKAGADGWISGRIVGRAGGEDGAASAVELTDFSLFHAELAPLAASVTPLAMSGTINRLCVASGRIDGGVFLGSGSLGLRGVKLAKPFLVKTQEALRLLFNPPTALVNRFPDDAVPFDQLLFGFELTKEGIALSSQYPSGVIGVFQSSSGAYSLFLPTGGEKSFAPYPAILSALGEEDSPYWSPFYRNAINRLPVE